MGKTPIYIQGKPLDVSITELDRYKTPALYQMIKDLLSSAQGDLFSIASSFIDGDRNKIVAHKNLCATKLRRVLTIHDILTLRGEENNNDTGN